MSGRPTATLDEPRALLVLALDAINFGSGYHDIVSKRPGCSGSVTMAQALTDYAERAGSLTPSHLASMTPQMCSEIFGQAPDGGARDELMCAFSSALNDLAAFIGDHEGTALSVVAAADGSAVALAERLTDMPYYRDVAIHEDREVAFYKRAQITAADLGREADLFNDLHRLTAFADNLVPHVLRVDGILRYNAELAASIDRGQLLAPGSRPEIEIRAAGVHAVELLAHRLGRRPMDLDATLWHRGGQARYKAVRRHRTRSVFY